MFTKQLTKISKSLLLDLANYNRIDEVKAEELNLVPEYRDYSKCTSSCPFYNIPGGREFCREKCVFTLSNSSLPSNKPTVKKSKVLTHTQISQLIFYHASVFDNKGGTLELTHKAVAETLGCSVRTARDNVQALVDAGHIFINYKTKYSYKVFVRDYYKYHQNNSRGYLYINNICFKAMLKINNINTLRFVMHAIVKLDDMRVTGRKNIKKALSYKSLISLLPTNICCSKQIKEIVSKAKDIFNIAHDNDGIVISFKTYTDSAKTHEKLIDENRKAINKVVKAYNLKELKDKDKADLLQMSIQYSIHAVTKAIATIKDFVPDNFGGYIRLKICKILNDSNTGLLRESI